MQLVICVDNDNRVHKKLNTIQINTKTLLVTSKEVSLQTNAEKLNMW
jgi:hypothetical protein